MNIYEDKTMGERIAGNPYVGRGIVTGLSESGKYAVSAYFIMGRSANSRNRVFVERGGEVFTEPFDASKVVDPSLIIYAAVRQYEDKLIVTNGDQTDTVYEGLKKGISFSEALESRCFEPDGPNFTPRISSMTVLNADHPRYELSILKSVDAEGSDCVRYTFSYPAKAGLGHFIHTYVTDGSPIPSFQGEPERVSVSDDLNAFAADIWDNLNEDNRISLHVRYTELATGKVTEKIINKNH